MFLYDIDLFFVVCFSTTQYLGFGLSGSTTATSMFEADATIAWVDENGMAQAQDYYLSNYVQVSHYSSYLALCMGLTTFKCIYH